MFVYDDLFQSSAFRKICIQNMLNFVQDYKVPSHFSEAKLGKRLLSGKYSIGHGTYCSKACSSPPEPKHHQTSKCVVSMYLFITDTFFL
jgi:hypothetical protein